MVFDNFGLELLDALGRAEQALAAKELSDLVKQGKITEKDFDDLFQRNLEHIGKSGVLKRLPPELKDKYQNQIDKITSGLEDEGEEVVKTRLLFSGYGTSAIGLKMREAVRREVDNHDGPLYQPRNQKLLQQLVEGPWPTQLPKDFRTAIENNLTFEAKAGTKAGDINISTRTTVADATEGITDEVRDLLGTISTSPEEIVVSGGMDPLLAVGRSVTKAAEAPILLGRFLNNPSGAVTQGFRNGLRGFGPVGAAITGGTI